MTHEIFCSYEAAQKFSYILTDKRLRKVDEVDDTFVSNRLGLALSCDSLQIDSTNPRFWV